LRFAIFLIGCFSPNVPSGGYLCSPMDSACPSDQHCTCGLCVKDDQEAACKFVVDTGTTSELTIHEHEKFHVNLSAQLMDGSPASRFKGKVTLSFQLPDGTNWGDVRPSQVQFDNGKAQADVTVNRETIPPQKPTLVAHFAGGTGSSPPLHVSPQPLARDPIEVAKPPFGWADLAVGFPSVIWDGKQFRMYFVGAGGRMQRGFGVATSSDGKTFTPNGVSLLPDSFMPFALSAFPFRTDNDWRVAIYATGSMMMNNDIYLGTSTDGLSNFSVGNTPVVARQSCAYCDFLVWFPSVLRTDKEYLMFFGAGHCNKPGGMCMGVNDGVSMAIGRARSTDGQTFATEPAPVLSGDMGGETYLASPQVVKDGSIFKMWYAFTRDVLFGDPCLADIHVGYATSTDGFYWVRSPSNPVLSLDGTGWEGNTRAMLPGSVVPLDGQDFESGVVLYYSPLATILVSPFCIPSGIGRAQNR
jgi:hypothetical protein